MFKFSFFFSSASIKNNFCVILEFVLLAKIKNSRILPELQYYARVLYTYSHYQGCFSTVFAGHSLKLGRLDSVHTALLDLTWVLLEAQTIVLTVY